MTSKNHLSYQWRCKGTWGQYNTTHEARSSSNCMIVPVRRPIGLQGENKAFTSTSKSSHHFPVCFFATPHVFICSLFFAAVVSELSEYWQTPSLSRMDTIYGQARVTACDLVKNEESLCKGGSKAEEPICLFSLTFMAAQNRWQSLFILCNTARL